MSDGHIESIVKRTAGNAGRLFQLNSNSNDLPVSSCMTPHTSNTVPLFMKQNSNKDMTDKTPTMTASPTNTVAALK